MRKLLAVTLILLFAAIAMPSGASPAVSQSSVASVPKILSSIGTDGWQNYTDASHGLTLKFPSYWQAFRVKESIADSTVLLRGPEGDVFLRTYTSAEALPKTTQSLTSFTVAKHPAQRVSLPGGQNPPQEIVDFSHDGIWYEMQFVRRGQDSSIFDRILNSVNFPAASFAPAAILPLLPASYDPCSQAGGPPSWGGYCPPQGTGWCNAIGSLDGIGVYWNGGNVNNGCHDAYGDKFQCVELIQRYYAQQWGHPSFWQYVMYAAQMMENHPSDIVPIWNGNSPAPQRGDALVFGGGYGGYGHVALVTRVEGGRVYFVEQNWSNVETYLTIDGNNHVSNRDTYTVRGWLHSLRNTNGTCTPPTNGNPRDGATSNARTVNLTWNAPASCPGLDVYTIRAVRDQSKIDSGPWVKDFGIDAPATSTSPTFDSDGDYYWAVWPCRGCKSGNPNYGQRSDVYHFRIDTGAGGNDGVELCDGTNFGSPCKIFTVGKYNLRDFGWESRADSARYRGSYVTNYHAVLYDQLNQQGYPVHMDQTSYPDLEIWKNAIKSIEIYYNPPTPLPQPPTLQSPDNGATFNEGNSIALSWSATGNEYYGEVWGGTAGTLTFGWQGGTSNNIGSQWAGYTYSWHVKARNATGESPDWSSTRTFTVKPAAPTNLSAQIQISSCRQITLTWQDNSGSEEGYKVYRDGALVGQVGANTTRFVDTGLVGATSYSYFVHAYRGDIQSDASSTTSVTTPRCPPVNAGALPWRCDTSGSVLQDRQSAFGLPAHYGLDQWAWDFGTTGSRKEVYAARSGIVAAVETGYSDPGWCVSSCDPNAVNRVVVDHGDGTAGLYLHLAQEIPASLHVGDPVVAGVTRIGYIDSTLQYNYAHVHYAVQAWNSAWNGTGVWYKPSVESLFYSDNSPKMIADDYNPTVSHSPYPSGNCTGVMTPTVTLSMGTQVHNRPTALELYRNTSSGRLDPPLFQATARTDVSGTVTFTLSSMVPNTYTLRVKPLSFLRKQVIDVNIGWTTTLDLSALCSGNWYRCGGDTVTDNKVNELDLKRLLSDWSPTIPVTNSQSDLNGDAFVNETDLSILLARWGMEGDGAWYLNAGDIVSDNKVNSIDLSQMLEDWNPYGPAAQERSDLNGDGKVNTIDLSMLYANWGKEGDGAWYLNAGDVVSDNKINTMDLSQMLEDWDPYGPAAQERSDLNGDGRVDATDLSRLLLNWGKEGDSAWYSCAGDIVSDNKVNELDLYQMATDWNSTDPAAIERSDLTGDGVVNAFDLYALSNAWGAEGDGGTDTHVRPTSQGVMSASGVLSLTLVSTSMQSTEIKQPTRALTVGEVMTVALGFDTAGLPMYGTNLTIDYDHCVLEPLVDLTTDTNVFSRTGTISRTGTLEYYADMWINSQVTPVTGTGYLAYVPFRVLAGTPDSTTISLRFKSNSLLSESNMVQDGVVQDFLGRVVNLSLYPRGANQRLTRLAQVSTPWSGTTINGSTILLETQAYDPCDGIRQVIFYVFYDAQWHNVGADTNGADGWSIEWDASQIADQVIKVKAFAGDMAGNGVETPINDGIVLDRKPPTISSFVFTPTTVLAGQPVTITAVFTDNLSQPASADVYIDPSTNGSAAWEAWRQIGAITGTTGSLGWNTTGFAPGPHKVVFVPKDNAGNQTFWPAPGDTQIVYSLRFGVYLPVVLKAYENNLSTVHADFSALPSVGRPPLTVKFFDQSSGVVTSRQWIFGDGTLASTEQNPLHVYSSAGVYTVSLRVSGASGSDTLTRTQYITVAETPVAGFITSQTSGVYPLTVVFTDTTVGLVTARAWAFGDGSSSWELNPIHQYSAAGVYTVSLTAIGPVGSDTIIRTNYITVTEPLTMRISP